MSVRTPVARSRVWSAFGAAAGAMVVVAVALLAIDLTRLSGATVPTLLIADGTGPDASSSLTVPVDVMADRSTHDVTIRLRNDSPTPARVVVTVSAGRVSHTATLTATLTEQGAVVRSGPLSALALPEFTVRARSVTPVTVQLTGTDEDLAGLWDTGRQLVFTVTSS